MEKNAFIAENHTVKTVNDTVTQLKFPVPPLPPLNDMETSASFFFPSDLLIKLY